MDNKNMELLKKQISKRCKDIYDKNLIALQKSYPQLYTKVVNYKSKNKWRIVPNSDNKTFNIFIDSTNKFYYKQKNQLYNVKMEIDNLSLRNTRIALFLGFGLGYEVIYFLQNLAKEQRNQRVVIIEKDLELFIYALHTTDIASMLCNESFLFMVDEPVDHLFTKFSIFFKETKNLMYMKGINPIYTNSALELYKDYYLKVIRIFKDAALFTLQYMGNSPDDSLLGLKNMFENLNEIINSPGINLLYDKFKNKPAIVVASGPSLKKNMHLLKGLEDKALLLSAESTFRILRKNGITPHIVASLERTIRTKSSFEDFTDDEVKQTYLAACPVIPKEAYEVYKGPKLVVYRDFKHFEWLKIDKGMLNIKHSSANMAFKIAAALGCNPIILVGQDLAFGKEDNSTHVNLHVKGTQQDRYYKDKRIKVMGNDGELIDTSESWYKFLKGYELDVSEYNGKCINATEGGAYIEGTEVINLQEVIDTYLQEEYNPIKIIQSNVDKFMKQTNIEDEYETIYKRLIQAIEDLDKMIGLCNEGLDLIAKYKDELLEYVNAEKLEEQDKRQIERIFLELVEPRNKMQNFSDTFQLLVMHVVQPIYIKLDIDMNEFPSKYEEFEKGIAEGGVFLIRWYETIKRLTDKIKEVLMNTERELENRICK